MKNLIVEQAYRCMTGDADFAKFNSAEDAISNFYKNPLAENQSGDEFIMPTQVLNSSGEFDGKIEDGDSVLFFNFHGDHPREITKAFTQKDFSGFSREKLLNIFYYTLTEYEVGLCEHVIFRCPEKMKNIIGEYLSNLRLKQFRCAETEKYAHVTLFFNDYREHAFDLEDRKLIASPYDVETYNQIPEMSAYAVKDAVKEAILSK